MISETRILIGKSSSKKGNQPTNQLLVFHVERQQQSEASLRSSFAFQKLQSNEN